MKKQHLGVWAIVSLAGGVSLGGVAACGSDFGSSDCRANRTCSDAVGGDGAGGNGAGDSAPGGDAAGGQVAGGAPAAFAGAPGASGEADAGGAPTATAGAGGAPVACHGPADCSNGDPADGEETCDRHGTCQPGNSPPSVLAVSPENESATADPDADIVITFSEPLDPATVIPDNIQVYDGGRPIAGTLAYADSKVTFHPAAPLFMLEPYAVVVGSAVTDADGAPMLRDFNSTFTTRDGAWTAINAVTGNLLAFSDSLPFSADGNVLLAWTATAATGCPASAGWFRLGKANGASQAFDPSDQGCQDVTASANAAGVGAVAWSVPRAGSLAQQFRSEAWQSQNAVVSTNVLLMPRVAVAPTGLVTLIAASATGSTAWRTDANGKWLAQGDPLSSDVAASPASIAFDAKGNGLAVWAANGAFTEILYSRYTLTSAKWSAAKAIPDALSFGGGAHDHAPALAMTPDGNAVAVWTQTLLDANRDHMAASVFSPVSGWAADAVELSPRGLDIGLEAPTVTFDGETFVVAWVAKPADTGPGVCDQADCVYTDRYDLQQGTWPPAVAQQTKVADVAAAKMPRLASDGHGNSLLVWAKPAAASTYSLVYQRFAAGKWGAIQALPGGSVTDANFADGPLALAMNGSGMAALAWGNRSANVLTTIHLASFF